MIHKPLQDCPGCAGKLKEAHPYLADWFLNTIKPKHPKAHVSWTYRNQADQELMLKLGTTKLVYPNSKHNYTVDGKPCAQAIDLFEIDEDGRAFWDPAFFYTIAQDIEAHQLPIFWGGRWPHLGDKDHFEMVPVQANS